MPWLRTPARAPALLLAAAAAALAPAARAQGGLEVWAYVDAQGTAHFADRALDDRYTPVLRNQAVQPEDRIPGKTMTRSSLLTWLEFAPEVKAMQPHLREAEAATGIDAELLKALIAVESGFRADSVSPRGALGLMQITPATAQRYLTPAEAAAGAVDEQLRDGRRNIQIGARLLADLWRRHGGVDRALAAWNAGEGALRRAGGALPDIPETRAHVHLVLELYWTLLQQRHLGQARQMRLMAPAAAPGPEPRTP
ncbi:lytic transglycosylase domain-containing protein [Ideonella sp.]|uniref:lytic transglycosylase domain-containing protein n=1 Tax=Ideonella sp. TaxID=1929293 RepID=UPI0035B15B1E